MNEKTEEEKVLVQFQIPKSALEKIKEATKVDANSTAILAAARLWAAYALEKNSAR